jgi:hypothetical protein
MIPDKPPASQLLGSSPHWVFKLDNVMLHPTETRPHQNAKPLPIEERACRGLSLSI